MRRSLRYPALIDGEAGAYGVVFPDLGIGAMGETVEQAMINAEDMLRDYIEEMERHGWPFASPSLMEDTNIPPGNMLVSIPLIRPSGKTVLANIELDESVMAFIDNEAERRDMTRKSYVTWMARRIAQMGG